MASVKTLTHYSMQPSSRGQHLSPLFRTSQPITNPLWTVGKNLASVQPMCLFQPKQMSTKQSPHFSTSSSYFPMWKKLENEMNFCFNNFIVAAEEHDGNNFSSREQKPSMSCVPLIEASQEDLAASKPMDCSQYFSSLEQHKPTLMSAIQNHCSDNVKTLLTEDKKSMDEEVILFKGSSTPQNFSETKFMSSDFMAPRKKAKKGRPSSRKQKKRQRAKTKQKPASKDMSNFLQDRNHPEQVKNSSSDVGQNCCKLQFVPVRKVDYAETSQKSCSITGISLNSQQNLEMKDNRTDHKDKYHSRQKYLRPTDVPKVKSSSPDLLLFSCGLNLSTIFNHKNDSFTQSSVQTTKISPIASQECSDHMELFSHGLYELCLSPVPSGNNSDLSLSQDVSCSDQEESQERLAFINARWEQHYQAPVTHNASNIKEGSKPVYKVHFAPDANLETVHFVGMEDRGGTWHLLALDRARFLRRIQEIGEVISPVLEVKHRAKVLMARQGSRLLAAEIE